MNRGILSLFSILLAVSSLASGDESFKGSDVRVREKEAILKEVAGLDDRSFRFQHHETTGLVNRVTGKDGKETAVIFTEDSDRKSLAILEALTSKKLIFGTLAPRNRIGIPYQQRIVLEGGFVSGQKLTYEVGDGAAAEKLRRPAAELYREFRITGLKVIFPLSCQVVAPKGNEFQGPFVIETHLCFESLFPDGILLEGKPIDLKKHAIELFPSEGP